MGHNETGALHNLYFSFAFYAQLECFSLESSLTEPQSESTKTVVFGPVNTQRTPGHAGHGDGPGMTNLCGNETLESEGKRGLPVEPFACKTERYDF